MTYFLPIVDCHSEASPLILPAADRFFEQLKVEVPQRSPGNDRQRLPVEMMLEDGCLATRRPSPASMRSLA